MQHPRANGNTLSTLQDLALAVLPVPDELASEEQFERFHHFDVPTLTRVDVERELVAVRLINLAGVSEWHLQREQRLVEALAS